MLLLLLLFFWQWYITGAGFCMSRYASFLGMSRVFVLVSVFGSPSSVLSPPAVDASEFVGHCSANKHPLVPTTDQRKIPERADVLASGDGGLPTAEMPSRRYSRDYAFMTDRSLSRRRQRSRSWALTRNPPRSQQRPRIIKSLCKRSFEARRPRFSLTALSHAKTSLSNNIKDPHNANYSCKQKEHSL